MLDYRIASKEGFTEKIGVLVSMLEVTRQVTVGELSALSARNLDMPVDDRGNTIGALLMHIAAIEYVHQVITFEKRDLNSEELAKWEVAFQLGEKAREQIKNKPLDFYTGELNKIRGKTLDFFKSKTDDWLYEEDRWGDEIRINNYFLWYHVMEDEISHRGQIRMMLRMLKDGETE